MNGQCGARNVREGGEGEERERERELVLSKKKEGGRRVLGKRLGKSLGFMVRLRGAKRPACAKPFPPRL